MTAQPEWGPSPEDGPPTHAWAPPPVADTRPWYRKLRLTCVPIAAFGGLVRAALRTGASSASPSASPATTTTSTVTTTASAAPVTVTSTPSRPRREGPRRPPRRQPSRRC